MGLPVTVMAVFLVLLATGVQALNPDDPNVCSHWERSATCHHCQQLCVWAQLQLCHIVIHSLSCFHIKAIQQLRGVRLGEFKAVCFCSLCPSCLNCTERDTNFTMKCCVISRFSSGGQK
ncbi:unnamed protein product [Tetraodon nigroviridis]|uniref:(spotted green pufferfish) hypothetical protein n=1 Tax=Tetraodon nigroviridis TaxID=99883 RepID=Q4SLY1_TETNG|nr:unnamed protein product [Tetraodon nigroviridis]